MPCRAQTSGAALHVDGDLQLRQRAPLSQGDHVTTWAGAQGSPFAPLLPSVDGTMGLAALQLGGVINQYLFRNETTVYDYAFPVWHAGSGYASLPPPRSFPASVFPACQRGAASLQFKSAVIRPSPLSEAYASDSSCS